MATKKGIDGSAFLFDPFDENVYENVCSKVDEFKSLSCAKYNHYKDKICSFIILCYDKNSPLIKITDLMARKREAAILVEFPNSENGKWSRAVENIILLQEEIIAKCTIRYILLFGMPEMMALQSWINALTQESEAIQKGTAKDNKKSLEIILQSTGTIKKLTADVFGGDELIDARKVLYEGIITKSLLRPESIIARLSEGDTLNDFNPYGDYTVDDLHFKGDE